MSATVETISTLRRNAASRLKSEVEKIAMALFEGRAVIKDAITSRLVYEVLNTVLWAETATPSTEALERIHVARLLGRHIGPEIITDTSIDGIIRRRTVALLIYAIDKLEECYYLLYPAHAQGESPASNASHLFEMLTKHFELPVRDARKLADDIIAEIEAAE